MGLDDFIKAHDVEISDRRPDANDLKLAEQSIRKSLIGILGDILSTEEIVQKEKELSTVFGPGLRRYLLECGYIRYSDIHFYGINGDDPTNSSLVTQTRFFNKHHPSTWGKFMLEDRGDACVLVSPDDEVYLFDTMKDELEAMTDTGLKITEYMMKRLSSIHGATLYEGGRIETFDEAWAIFEEDLHNHHLPDFGQPTAKEVSAKKKEKASMYSRKELMNHMQLPSKKMLTDECIKMLYTNLNIPPETDIWVDKCIAYYFPHGVILNESRMNTKTGDSNTYFLDPRKILKPLYKYKGCSFYTWKEIYSFIIY
ncbi:MAG: hypothetical protein K5857_03980 [Lachnospiraceae bacterium]|nr:hypothetical protein [Lachnospiraceae bacterium]